MCGIVAVLGKSVSEAVFACMNAALAHRGPDGTGTFHDECLRASLGHTRLAIQDPRDIGNQPLKYYPSQLPERFRRLGERYREKGFVIVFNGEIYNFKELRRRLMSDGFEFRTGTDTEVILALFAREGSGCFRQLSGMFAFVLIDLDLCEAYIVRDVFGIKPLYTARIDGGLVVGSELRPLLASGLVERKVCIDGLASFALYGSFDQSRSIVRGVSPLPPGHFVKFSQHGLEMQRFYDLRGTVLGRREVLGKIGWNDAVELIRSELRRAVAEQMISDVDVGAFLSGGLDSTAIVSLASLQASRATSRLKTFCIDGTIRENRDAEFAEMVAKELKTEHFTWRPSSSEIVDEVSAFVAATDQPSVEGLNTFLASRLAAKHVKVSLVGVGADELFGGYPHFAALRVADHFAPGLPRAMERGIELLSAILPRGLGFRVEYFSRCSRDRYALVRRIRRSAEVRWSYPKVRTRADRGLRYLARENEAITDSITYSEFTGYLRSTILRDSDAYSMAVGLELRPVFLDQALVEIVLALPAALREAVPTKRLLRDAVAPFVPAAVASRRKTGFDLPLVTWLRGPLRPDALAAFDSSFARTAMSPELRRLRVKQLQTNDPAGTEVWADFVLCSFCERHALSL